MKVIKKVFQLYNIFFASQLHISGKIYCTAPEFVENSPFPSRTLSRTHFYELFHFSHSFPQEQSIIVSLGFVLINFWKTMFPTFKGERALCSLWFTCTSWIQSKKKVFNLTVSAQNSQYSLSCQPTHSSNISPAANNHINGLRKPRPRYSRSADWRWDAEMRSVGHDTDTQLDALTPKTAQLTKVSVYYCDLKCVKRTRTQKQIVPNCIYIIHILMYLCNFEKNALWVAFLLGRTSMDI